jgi:hypothetical protein
MTVSCLHKFAVLLKENYTDNLNEEIQIDPQQKELGFLIMDLVSCLLSHSSSNASKNCKLLISDQIQVKFNFNIRNFS